MKLSFIVPIYGVEPYLRKCVDSLLHQDYADYEIILVDDGSQDGCPAICDEYAAKFGNIMVVHQENRGLSGARNGGLPVAKGEYICFVDSDDYWEENVLGGLMTQIERDNLDVLRFRWQNVRILSESESESERLEYEVFKPYKEENFVDFSSEPLNGLDYLNQRMGIQCYAWSFIVQAALVRGNKAIGRLGDKACVFTEGILFEDTDWTPRMLVKANRVAGTDTIVYNYLWRDGGITLNKDSRKLLKEVEDKLALVSRLKEWGDTLWYKGMISALVVSVVGLLSVNLYAQRKPFLQILNQLKVLPLSMAGLNKKTQRKARLINISPALAVKILNWKNR